MPVRSLFVLVCLVSGFFDQPPLWLFVPQLELATFFNQSLVFFLLMYTSVPFASFCLTQSYVRPRILSRVYVRSATRVLGIVGGYRPLSSPFPLLSPRRVSGGTILSVDCPFAAVAFGAIG
jgi:hypothetical protein